MDKVSSSGPAVAKRVRVRDALLQFASGGQYVSLAKAAEILEVSEYLVKRMLWEHRIELPRRRAPGRSHSGLAAAKRERVKAGLLQLQSEGQLTSRRKAAEALGVSYDRVRRVIREQGIELNSSSPKFGRARVGLLNLVRAGKVSSQAEAARHLGVSRQRVHQMLAAEGINLSPRPPKPRCARCGRTLLNPNGRSALDGLCTYCRGGGKFTVVCPTCGKARDVFYSVYKTRKSDLCRLCVEPERRRRAREALARLRAARQSR